jgi:sortase A
MKHKYTFYIAAIAAFAWMIPAQITSQKAEFSLPFVAPQVAEAAPALPAYLTIPEAKVSANIIEVGITKTGNLDVPNNYVEVGWYKYGPKPGEMGSAVLDAHVDDAKSTPGPFKHLRNAKVGDDIYVTMTNGNVLHYKVTLSEVHPTKKFPGEQVFHQNDQKYLKLITCHGKFVKAMGTYDERLIVTAVLVS